MNVLRQGIEAEAGVKLGKRVEVGVAASAPWTARSAKDVAVKGLFKWRFW